MQGNETTPASEQTLSQLIKEFEELLPASCADLLKDREPSFIRDVLVGLNENQSGDIFSHFSHELQLSLSEMLSARQLTTLVTHMSHDERVDFFQLLPEERQESLFRRLAQSERDDIIRLGAYEEGTAGAAMTSEYVTLPIQDTATEAIQRLRREAPEKETIYESYVVDEQRKLIGVVSLKDLILAPTTLRVSEIMRTDIIYVHSSDDQEEAAQKIAKYDLLSIPVINENDALVGIITHDDVIDILTEEHTEDVEKLMAITSSGGEYLSTSSFVHFKRRATWIVSLAALGLASGFILHANENLLDKFVILALYMPMMADTGGHIGGQSVAVLVRAIATGEVQVKDWWKVLWKETKIASMMAIILAVLAFVKILILSSPEEVPAGFSMVKIAATITLALVVQVFSATFIGAGLPLLAERFKLDPAVVAAPALTTIVDIVGIFLYFKIASAIMFH
ncbi:MAG: magnesium transporter [Bdellovibrionota bacterium]